MGKMQCNLFINCVKEVFDAVLPYTSRVDECIEFYDRNDSHVRYGLIDSGSRGLEYVISKSPMPDVPLHIRKKCSQRLPVIEFKTNSGWPAAFKGRQTST